MTFHAVEFTTVKKSLGLGIKRLSCKAAVCLHLAVIIFLITFCMCAML